jgi:anti-anti-sigma regulatory factor
MLKISIVDAPSQRTLVVEGMLVGAWIAELGRAWENACRERGNRKLVIDLRNLTTISRAGEDAIFDLMKQGAKFCCGNILTNYLVKRLARKKQQELAEW